MESEVKENIEDDSKEQVDTKSSIENALNELVNANEKVNISRVAMKASVSNSLIHNRYPDLAFKINQAKESQKLKMLSIDNSQEVERLKKEIAKLKQKSTDSKQVSESYQRQNEDLWEHIQQVYGMYDQILAERNGFADRLKHYK